METVEACTKTTANHDLAPASGTADNEAMASFAQLNVTEGAPASVHTEIAILGAMLLDSVAITDATARLLPEDFSLDSHQRVYRAIIDMVAVGQRL